MRDEGNGNYELAISAFKLQDIPIRLGGIELQLKYT